MRRLSSPLVRLFLIVIASVWMAGCASTPVVVEEEPPPPVPVSPLDGYRAVVADEAGVVVRDPTLSSQPIAATGPIGFVSNAPDASAVVFARGGTLMAVTQEDGMIDILAEGDSERVYSGAWSRDGSRFHFGYYVPAGDGMGKGGISTWDRAAGDVRAVGCSASKVVLAELEDGSLLVRNEDNLYEVEAEGCGTIRSVDARKMYHVAVSPDGRHLAYILRDLVYNREERAYEPDSTLYIESAKGSDPIKVIGDKYAPRNLSWRPDGSELLYDVAPPDDAAQRAVSIYTVDDARSTYLLPPSTTTAATHAMMSPGGQHVLYKQTTEDGAADWQVKTAGSTFSQSLPMPEATVGAVNWLDGSTLIIHTPGSSYLLSVSGAAPTLTDLEAPVVWLW